MITKFILGAVGFLALSAIASAEPTKAMLREAKVDRMHAERIALAATHGGKMKGCELEREHGKLIWSCDVAMPNSRTITEVAVDAEIGKVLSVKKESAADEAKERRGERKSH